MTESAVEQFRALLSSRFGWRFDNDRGQLAQVLASRIGMQQSPAAYLAALATAAPDAPEVRELAEAFAVSETYFFRNPDHFAVLDEVALPAAVARRPAGPIRILSAGAASGEEAYSIAITLLRSRRQPTTPVEIVGVDVSRRAIDKARRGRYTAWALRGLPAALRAEFFRQEGHHFQIAPEVGRLVQFHEGNLLDLRLAAPGPWDIVFFRNTFMYFTIEVARGIFTQLEDAMTPGAFLFLGHAETLRDVSDAFSVRQSHDTFYYVFGPAAASRPASAPAATAPPPGPLQPASDDAWFHEIARATERVAALVDGRQAPPAAAVAATGIHRGRPCADCVADALALLAQERLEAALEALQEGPEPERLLLRAVLLVNLGRVVDARAACTAVLAADSLHAGAYYVQALCEERERHDREAVRHDEMASYLDDTFAMPQLHLASLARRRGDRAAAQRHMQRARDLLASEDDLRIVLFGGGFSRQSLIQMCDRQLGALAS